MSVKDAILSLFGGECDVYNAVESVDENGVSSEEWSLVQSGIKCRLVFGGAENYAALKNAGSDLHKNRFIANLRVFMPPETEVKTGSRLVVRQNGEEYRLRCTSRGALYGCHREIMALPWETEVGADDK